VARWSPSAMLAASIVVTKGCGLGLSARDGADIDEAERSAATSAGPRGCVSPTRVVAAPDYLIR
jgi:hypothetical protein